jgi:hypothetical protein
VAPPHMELKPESEKKVLKNIGARILIVYLNKEKEISIHGKCKVQHFLLAT